MYLKLIMQKLSKAVWIDFAKIVEGGLNWFYKNNQGRVELILQMVEDELNWFCKNGRRRAELILQKCSKTGWTNSAKMF